MRVAAFVGEQVEAHLESERSAYDYRRIFVSNPDVVGRKLRGLPPNRSIGEAYKPLLSSLW